MLGPVGGDMLPGHNSGAEGLRFNGVFSVVGDKWCELCFGEVL